MEIVVSLLTIIISGLSVGGIIINNSLTKIITRQSIEIEEVDVRVENVPTHQLLKGEIDSIKLNLKEWEIRENIQVELLQLETDKVKVDLPILRSLSSTSGEEKRPNLQQILQTPLNMGWRVVVTEENLNDLFLSNQVKSVVEQISQKNERIDIVALDFDLLPNNRLAVDSKVKLAFRGEEELNIRLEFGLEVIKGYQLKIKDIEGTLNDRKLSSTLLKGFSENINSNLTLQGLEKSGITLRLLQFEINEDKIAVAGFAHIQPQSP